MNFETQGEHWFHTLRRRKRNPVKPGTLVVYRSYLKNHILPRLANVDVSTFNNASMRTFAASLSTPNNPLGPKTQNEIVSAVKQIIGSAIDDNGEELYPRKWNADFIDLPVVNRREQKRPSITGLDVARAVRKSGLALGTFYAMLGGTGLRIGEALAVRSGDDGIHSGWDPRNRLILVRTQMWRGQEITPKTSAGFRQVDLHPRLNDALVEFVKARRGAGGFLFQNEAGGFMHETTIRQGSLAKLEIPGFHTFRRFRTTKLREFGVPEDLIRFWLGHEGGTVTDGYSKLAEDVEVRRSWAERVGLGFEIDIREAICQTQNDTSDAASTTPADVSSVTP